MLFQLHLCHLPFMGDSSYSSPNSHCRGHWRPHLHHGVLLTAMVLVSLFSELLQHSVGCPITHSKPHGCPIKRPIVSPKNTVGYWRAGNDDLVPFLASAGHRQGGSKCQPTAESSFNTASRFLSTQDEYIHDLCCLKSHASWQGVTPPFPQGNQASVSQNSKDIQCRSR